MKVQMYHNPDEHSEKPTKFGDLQVKKYLGNNVEIQFLQLLAKEEGRKYIGTVQFVVKEDAWYLFPYNAKTRDDAFRIKEPENGIEEILDIEFKRVRE